MYAVIRRYAGISSESTDELMRRVNEDFVPIISSAAGFAAYYALNVDGGAVSISIFGDQAAADESTRQAAEWEGQNLASLVPEPPEVIAGEIRVQAGGGAGDYGTTTAEPVGRGGRGRPGRAPVGRGGRGATGRGG